MPWIINTEMFGIFLRWKVAIFGSIAYNPAIVYKRLHFLKVVIHVIVTDLRNQTAHTCKTKLR